jgi:nucleoside phosphorylase
MIRPSSRDDFEVAIICALRREYNAVLPLFSELWDEQSEDDEDNTFGRVGGDTNIYANGCIGNHNVVLVLLRKMGKRVAAGTAAQIATSYTRISLALLIGVCGGIPRYKRDEEDIEILLGDVIVGTKVVEFDFGREYPDGIISKNNEGDQPGKPNKNISNLLETLQTDLGLKTFRQKTPEYLEAIRNSAPPNQPAKYSFPGREADKLFKADYRHKHQYAPTCECALCARWRNARDPVCEASRKADCADLKCDETQLESRKLESRQQFIDKPEHPVFHFGAIASGDRVEKSGIDRDKYVKDFGVIAFEMEGAGVWDELPCLVVKAVCDYADSHKNKKWQDYTAAVAAAAAKAILALYPGRDKPIDGELSLFSRSVSA